MSVVNRDLGDEQTLSAPTKETLHRAQKIEDALAVLLPKQFDGIQLAVRFGYAYNPLWGLMADVFRLSVYGQVFDTEEYEGFANIDIWMSRPIFESKPDHEVIGELISQVVRSHKSSKFRHRNESAEAYRERVGVQ